MAARRPAKAEAWIRVPPVAPLCLGRLMARTLLRDANPARKPVRSSKPGARMKGRCVMAIKTLFNSLRGRHVPAADSRNHEGAPAYRLQPEAALAQLAATG